MSASFTLKASPKTRPPACCVRGWWTSTKGHEAPVKSPHGSRRRKERLETLYKYAVCWSFPVMFLLVCRSVPWCECHLWSQETDTHTYIYIYISHAHKQPFDLLWHSEEKQQELGIRSCFVCQNQADSWCDISLPMYCIYMSKQSHLNTLSSHCKLRGQA